MTATGAGDPRRGAQKSERLEARITADQKALFLEAADVLGRSLTDFVVSSVHDAAMRALRDHQITTLSARDSERFVEALLNPPAPGTRLRTAARRYRQDQS